jgi:hypothetical protein
MLAGDNHLERRLISVAAPPLTSLWCMGSARAAARGDVVAT